MKIYPIIVFYFCLFSESFSNILIFFQNFIVFDYMLKLN
jgi:hypothetical protein